MGPRGLIKEFIKLPIEEQNDFLEELIDTISDQQGKYLGYEAAQREWVEIDLADVDVDDYFDQMGWSERDRMVELLEEVDLCVPLERSPDELDPRLVDHVNILEKIREDSPEWYESLIHLMKFKHLMHPENESLVYKLAEPFKFL